MRRGMGRNSPLLPPGSLGETMGKRIASALACGALQPIETEFERVCEDGLCFLLRLASSLKRKAADATVRRREARTKGKEEFNPFLPPEPELTVGDITPTHLAVLNKFNVIDRHLLIVPRRFEDQETLLTRTDFEALWACMAEFESLGFYNGGQAAGASQRHKHLQLIPLPLTTQGPGVPMEPLFAGTNLAPLISKVPAFRFLHGISGLPTGLERDPGRAARVSFELYQALLDFVGIKSVGDPAQRRQSAPYNLLLTRRWMLLVPRSRECFDSISVNALGFVGSMFVKDEREKNTLIRRGLFSVLRSVAIADPRTSGGPGIA